MSTIDLDNDSDLFKGLMLNLLGHDFAHDFKLQESSLGRISKKEILDNLTQIVNFSGGGKKKKNTLKKKKIKKSGGNGTKRKREEMKPPEDKKQKLDSQEEEMEIDIEQPEESEEEDLLNLPLYRVDILEEAIFEIIFYIFGFINIELPTNNDTLKESIHNSINICLKEIQLDRIKILNYKAFRKLEMYDELLNKLNYYKLIEKILEYLKTISPDNNFQLDNLVNFETIENIKLLILNHYNETDDNNVRQITEENRMSKGGGNTNISEKYNDKIDNALIFQLIDKDVIVSNNIQKKHLDIIKELRNELIQKINGFMSTIFEDIPNNPPTESKIVNNLLLGAIKNVFIKSSDDKKEYYYYHINFQLEEKKKTCKSEFIKDVLFNFFIKFLLVPDGLIQYSGPSTNEETRRYLIQNLRMVLSNGDYLGISSEILLPDIINENNLRNYLFDLGGQNSSNAGERTEFKKRIEKYNNNLITELLKKECLITIKEEEQNENEETFDIAQLQIVSNTTKLIVKNVLTALNLSNDKYANKKHTEFLNNIPNNIDDPYFSEEFLQIQSKILYSGILGLNSLNELKSWDSNFWSKSPITGYSDIDKLLIESFQTLNKDKLFVRKFKPSLVSSFSLEEQFCSKKGYKNDDSLKELNKLFEKDKAYIINNAAPLKELSCRLQSNTNLYKNLLCPISSIIDAATGGQQSCPLYKSDQSNVEFGNMNVNFKSNGLNYLFTLKKKIKNVEMNVNCNLGNNIVINSILQQDISKKSLISASNTFKNITETFINILNNYKEPKKKIWEIIDSNKDFVLKTINCGTRKSLGDFIQELNAVLLSGGYIRNSYSPKSSEYILPINFDTGDTERVLFSNDRPSGVRYMLMDLYLPQKNKKSNGGYLSNFEIIVTKPLSNGGRKKTLKKNKKKLRKKKTIKREKKR